MGTSCSPREYCPLFTGLSDEDYAYARSFFSAEEKKYPKGEVLKQTGSNLKYFGYVISGTVQVYMDDLNGDRMIMNNVGPGKTFGESLCFLGRRSYAVIRAASDTVLLRMDASRVCVPSSSEGSPRDSDITALPSSAVISDIRELMLSERFVAMLAARTLEMNKRIQILSKRTIREKLLAFLSQEYAASVIPENRRLPDGMKDGDDLYGETVGNKKRSADAAADRDSVRTVTVRMNREDMAAYLGTDPSALSREMSRMKKEGILDYRKSVFRIL